MAKARKPMRRMKKPVQAPAECYYCKEQKEPVYMDTSVLMRFISERGKITPRSRNGLCAKHQRRFNEAVKHARLLALLPFIVRD